ncbi:MAG: VUT family protein [Planctomycetes bacterium]|nr:VUT family protein [Planctomycetota bacterium]
MSEQAKRLVAREQVLAYVLCALFVGFFVAAEVLGGKLFRFTLFGLGPDDIGLGDGAEFAATAGILAFPLTFVMTDIVNEYFGRPIVKLFTWIAIAVNLLLQPVIRAAIAVPAISFTPGISDDEMQRGFQIALGQTTSIVFASLIAFALAQWLDVQVFTWLRRITGGKWLWLRAQGSTIVSQMIDTIAVIYLAFVVIPMLTGNQPWSMADAFQVSVTNYVYKFLIAVGSTPALYLVHAAVDRYLGKATAEALVHHAHPSDPE